MVERNGHADAHRHEDHGDAADHRRGRGPGDRRLPWDPTDAHPTTGGPLYTVQQMGGMTVDVVQALGTLPVKVLDVGKAILGLQDRDPRVR